MPLSSYYPTIWPLNIPFFPKELKRTWTFSSHFQLHQLNLQAQLLDEKQSPQVPFPFWRHLGRIRALPNAVSHPFIPQPFTTARSTSNFHETRNDIPSQAPTSEAWASTGRAGSCLLLRQHFVVKYSFT